MLAHVFGVNPSNWDYFIKNKVSCLHHSALVHHKDQLVLTTCVFFCSLVTEHLFGSLSFNGILGTQSLRWEAHVAFQSRQVSLALAGFIFYSLITRDMDKYQDE